MNNSSLPLKFLSDTFNRNILFFSEKSCLQQLIEIFSKKKSSVIAVNQIDKENIHKYGVIKPDKISGRIMKVDDIIENAVSKSNSQPDKLSLKEEKEEPKNDTIEKIELDEEEPSSWGGWCSIS